MDSSSQMGSGLSDGVMRGERGKCCATVVIAWSNGSLIRALFSGSRWGGVGGPFCIVGIVWSRSSLLEDALVRGIRDGIDRRLMAFDKILVIFRGPILYEVSLGDVNRGVGLLTVDM